ncbi:tRNA-dihydrouridine synthase family protein [Thiospirochaeta perfilievii]|uniref:tRNA-dihydrouridine synthase n=1 Tax=Thiospirochaeta perfilievii TaxID=252967 RepID=A0A5C1QG04_9SPIO|nr:tRNA-dihydrouridine synthase family protein [Thiospirochaeta perfilievii]QEN05466.1 tRNA-dihydrouridine synthase family protein [Thiospirochaeta perfilievii]
MGNKLVLAPIKGYTDPIWRSCYFEHFTGIDKVVTPFLLLSEHNEAKKSYFPRFLPELGSDIEVVPQYLVKNPDTIIYSSKIMASLGVKEFNLNMGCPAPAIYKKGRGSGLLENLDSVKHILDSVVGNIPGDFTVKIRTGIVDSSLVKPILDILNEYTLKEVIVHPRYSRQLYGGSPDMEAFKYVYDNSTNPVSYNGDIYSLGDFKRVSTEFPRVSSWMLGRGVLQNPYLPIEIKTGKVVDQNIRKEGIINFISDFRSRLKGSYDKEGIAANRVKACLIYIAAYYNNSPQFITKIKQSRNLDQILDMIFLN